MHYRNRGVQKFSGTWWKAKEDLEDLEVQSATTACASHLSSTSSDDERQFCDDGQKQGRQLLSIIRPHSVAQDSCLPPPPPPPPTAPPKTKLKSKASMFVPKAGPSKSAAPTNLSASSQAALQNGITCAQSEGVSSGRDHLQGIIQSASGSELWSISMLDYAPDCGDWYIVVEIALPAIMCHVASRQDMAAFAAAEQAMKDLALQSLIESLESASSKMAIGPSSDCSSHLSLQFCDADRDMLCWEFAESGRCPRGSSCRWAHARVESFEVSFVMQAAVHKQQGLEPLPAPGINTSPALAADEPRASSNLSCRSPVALPLTSMCKIDNGCTELDTELDLDDTPWPSYLRPCFGLSDTLADTSTATKEKEVAPEVAKDPRKWQ